MVSVKSSLIIGTCFCVKKIDTSVQLIEDSSYNYSVKFKNAYITLLDSNQQNYLKFIIIPENVGSVSKIELSLANLINPFSDDVILPTNITNSNKNGKWEYTYSTPIKTGADFKAVYPVVHHVYLIS